MGEVYRARDEALGRDVAIKILPASVAADPDRLARFTREAQTLAALNHPNIAQIYGVEKAGDTPALVMELVDGPTLEARIGPPGASGASAVDASHRVDEAVALACQIASGLEAAHDKGIVHRDVKPANIKVTGIRPGEAPRLRPRQARLGRSVVNRRPEFSDDDGARNRGRDDSGDRRLHESGAGARQDRGQARRHLGVRRRVLRIADRPASVQRRHGLGHPGCRSA
jgi:serine/threonine protein kinase